MKKLLIGIFYWPHPIHKLWFDQIGWQGYKKMEFNFSKVIEKQVSIFIKFIYLILNFPLLISLFWNFFSKKILYLEGFFFFSLYKYIFPNLQTVAVVADPLVFRLWKWWFLGKHISRVYIFFLKKVDYLLATSHMIESFLIDLWIEQKHIIYMPSFLDEERKIYIDEEKLFVIDRNLTCKKLVTIANGNDIETKWINFLDTLAISLKETGWKIEVIGKWDDMIKKQYSHLHFLGRMNPKDMYNYLYKNCSLWIIAWEWETFSCAALEMWYMKIPVIVREHVWFREVLKKTNLTNFIIKDSSDIIDIIRGFETWDLDYQKIWDSIKNQINSSYTQSSTIERINLFSKQQLNILPLNR